MCCTGSIRLGCCRLHLVAMVCLIVVAIVVSGHILIDAAGLSTAPLAGPHLHGGFPLPAVIAVSALLLWIFSIALRGLALHGWIERPATPPPLRLP